MPALWSQLRWNDGDSQFRVVPTVGPQGTLAFTQVDTPLSGLGQRLRSTQDPDAGPLRGPHTGLPRTGQVSLSTPYDAGRRSDRPVGRVLRSDGTTVPGLRAAGGVAVGLAGEHSGGYTAGNGLLSAFGMGWIVGNDVARPWPALSAQPEPRPAAARHGHIM